MEEALYSSYRGWNYYLPGLLLLSLIYWLGDVRLFITAELVFIILATLHRRSLHITVLKDRLVIKRGLFRPSLLEIRMDEIKGMRINQGTFGFLCDYGHLEVDGPSGTVVLTGINDPEGFEKLIKDLKRG